MENLTERIERVIKKVETMNENEKLFIILAYAEFEVEKNSENYIFSSEKIVEKVENVYELKKKIYRKFNIFYLEQDEYNIEIQVRKNDLFFVANDVSDNSQSVFVMNYEEFEKLNKMVKNG